MSKLYRFQGCAGAEVGQEEFFNRSGVMDMLDTVLEGCVCQAQRSQRPVAVCSKQLERAPARRIPLTLPLMLCQADC